MQMRTAWATRVAKIVKEMPTLKKGNKLGLTHAGLSTWESPVFISTPSSSQHMEDVSSADKAGYREHFASRRRNQDYNVNDLPSDDDEDDDDLSFHSSSMSEEP